MEWVQRKATKIILDIQNHRDQQQLKDLELISLSKGDFEGNLLRCLKIWKDSTMLFP